MSQSTLHHFGASDDDDRRSRFASPPGLEDMVGKNHNGGVAIGGPASLRERAASQPPRSSDQNFLPSPSSTQFIPSSLGGGTANQWSNSRFMSSGRGNHPIPTRSASYSTTSQSQFSTAMRERVFPSMHEDDESEDTLSDSHEELYVPPSLGRGKSYGQDPTRSRSQSLATGTRPSFGSSYFGPSAMEAWNESLLSNNASSPLAIPGRYGEIKPPGQSRYGSLGTIGRSPSNYFSSSPSNNFLGSDLSSNRFSETNQSPFRRDVGKILLDDGSAFRELWAGMNPPRDENGGGGSGTTSRRHSVSVVQRKGIVGFNASRTDGSEESSRASNAFVHLSDEDLASDLGMLNLSPNEPPSLTSSSNQPPSQPASLPIYAPLSRSPPTRDLLSQYQNMTLNIQNPYVPRQQMDTPTESELSAGGSSPTKNSPFDQFQQDTTARFIPGQGFKYPTTGDMGTGSVQLPYLRHRQTSFSSSNALNSPISPLSAGGSRLVNPQQQPYYAQPIQRRPSEPPTPLSSTSTHIPQPPSASINLKNPPLPHGQHQTSQHQQQQQQTHQQPNLNDLGKGVPLHSVPPSCPLFIVEFKAGRTDLFYLTDPSVDIKINDLVIVEADRGKDLGKVINDTITIEEVEAWQRQQAEQAAAAAASIAAGMGYWMEGPLSPGGSAQGGGQQQQQPTKKDINPKMILAKAEQQDTASLATKAQDELKALQLCRSKVKAKKLPMEVIDAEYQWDRRKLTFYFIAEKRIDFRELVRELFRLYKTRIWMASVQSGISYEQ